MEAVLIPFLADMAQQYPVAMAVMVWFGVFRAVFKPLMLAIDSYFTATPSKEDDAKWASLKSSKIYQGLVWLVDYSTSIKLPK